MEELTIEQKAEAYDKALDRARIWKEMSGMPKDKQGILDNIFPELKDVGDERIRKNLIELFHDVVSNDEIFSDYGLDKTEVLAWLEKQKPSERNSDWSDEDERIRKALINGFNKLDKSAVWYNGITNGQILAWLEKQNLIMAKSPQLGEQKPAWSEKDEEMFMSLYSPNFTKEQRDWLKSLKDRIGCELNCTTMWKPSDEQMEALEQFISEYKDIDDNFRAYPISHNIESLYNDLKKLTE